MDEQTQSTYTPARKPFLNGLAGLKFLAVLLMVYWHSPLKGVIESYTLFRTDVGARACEFLFVVSGFLVVYNYKRKYNNFFYETIAYSLKKWIKIWPLHFICFLVMMFIYKAYGNNDIPKMILNLSLLHSLVNDQSIYMSYNGASWFLSVIFLCYVFVPLFIKLCKNWKVSAVCFVVLLMGRTAFDFMITRGTFVFDIFGKYINLQTSFFVRVTEFLLGMLVFPVFAKIKELILKLNFNKLLIFSIAEFCILILTVIFIRFIRKDISTDLPRPFYIAGWVAVVCVFGFDGGVISKACSVKVIRFLSGIQFEFYIMHQPLINVYLYWLIRYFSVNAYLFALVVTLLLILLSWLYKTFVGKYIEKGLKFLFNKLFSITKVDIRI